MSLPDKTAHGNGAERPDMLIKLTRIEKSLSLALIFCVTLIAEARAAEPQQPGLNQLVILDPEAGENGAPAVRRADDGKVEIPATLHVHPYYYSSDMEYQAQILKGGPTVVVASHPKTQKKMYVDVVLPAGAPVIAYNRESITYVYTDHRIEIHFYDLFPNKVKVRHHHGRGLGRGLRDASNSLKEKVTTGRKQSGLFLELSGAAEGTGKVLKGAGGMAVKATSSLIERGRAIAGLFPGMKALQSISDRIPEEQQKEEIRQAGLEQVKNETKFFPTLR
jgi:hypothetical protein